jgi:serralysin
MIVALFLALAPATSSPHAPTSREMQMREAHLRAAAAKGAIGKVAKPKPRKGKVTTMPGKLGPKAKPTKKRMKPPARLGKKKPLTSAPCSTIDAPSHDGAVRPGMEGLVADKYWVWPNGSKLHVYFLDGSEDARIAVAKVAAEWSEFANIDFVFHFEDARPPQVDIAITFDDPACNASMGPGSRDAAMWGPSMRLCHIDQMMGSDFFRRTVLHEFGHALGMHHEHQSPKAAYSWNKPNVYAYYAQIGWSEPFVDQWVFRKINENEVRASAWDPHSVMHYEFPASFTTDNTPIHGGTVLSEEDKRFIAEIYPGRGSKPTNPKAKPRPLPKMKHYAQRRVILRNDTNETLLMDIVVERKSGDTWKWVPSKSPETKGARFTIQPGGQKLLPVAMHGRKARVRAQSVDGKRVWSDHLDTEAVLVDASGYDDRAMQSYVIATSGDPDGAPTIGRDEQWNTAQAELDAGDWQSALAGFDAFVTRFPDDPWVPWAKLYMVMSLIGQTQFTEAAFASYSLIVDHPDADASRYAWFYGGVAALERGACEDAQAYFDVAANHAGLPSDWVGTAKDYLREIDDNGAAWCG